MNPWVVSVMMRSPRRRTTRTASASTTALWDSGSSGSTATRRPSAFDTTFWVTTSTSLSCNGPFGGSAHAAAMMSPSCSPGVISPIPVTPHAVNRCTRPSCQVSASAARSRATFGSDMIVFVTKHRSPSASTAEARCASCESMIKVPHTSA